MGFKYVYWDTYGNYQYYRVRFPKGFNTAEKSKSFSPLVYGGKKNAAQAACKYRDKVLGTVK